MDLSHTEEQSVTAEAWTESMDRSPSRVELNVPGAEPGPSEGGVITGGYIQFQAGPVAEFGHNGTTIEAVLDVLINRLQGFQRGPFSNDYNALAIQHMVTARQALERRTADRVARGVEGTNSA